MGQGERCTRIMTHEYIGAGTDGSSNEAFIDRRYKESADWILSGYRTITASVFSISRSFTKGKESNWISPEEFTLWKRISGMVMYGVFFFFFFFFFLVFVFVFKQAISALKSTKATNFGGWILLRRILRMIRIGAYAGWAKVENIGFKSGKSWLETVNSNLT